MAESPSRAPRGLTKPESEAIARALVFPSSTALRRAHLGSHFTLAGDTPLDKPRRPVPEPARMITAAQIAARLAEDHVPLPGPYSADGRPLQATATGPSEIAARRGQGATVPAPVIPTRDEIREKMQRPQFQIAHEVSTPSTQPATVPPVTDVLIERPRPRSAFQSARAAALQKSSFSFADFEPSGGGSAPSRQSATPADVAPPLSPAQSRALAAERRAALLQTHWK